MRYEGDEIFTLTPLMGLSWTFDDIWERRTEDHIECVTVDMDDNPYLAETAKQMVLDGLSEEEKMARKQGRFVHFSGLIYAEFDTNRHVRAPFQPGGLPENMNVWVGIDPGLRYAAAVVYCGLDVDGMMYVFDEVYIGGATVAEVARKIHLNNAKWQVHPLSYIIDPAARNKLHQTGRSDQMEYADHGIVTIAGQNDVTAGINRVKERLQTDRLLISANCENLIHEMRRYRWKDPPRTGEDAKEMPVKTKDHLLDALRYVCMARPYSPVVEPPDTRTELQKAFDEDRNTFERSDRDEFGLLAF